MHGQLRKQIDGVEAKTDVATALSQGIWGSCGPGVILVSPGETLLVVTLLVVQAP